MSKTIASVKIGEHVFVDSSVFQNEHGVIYIDPNTTCSTDEYKSVSVTRVDDGTFTYKGKVEAAGLRKTGRKNEVGDSEYEYPISGVATINIPTVKQWNLFGFHITLAY